MNIGNYELTAIEENGILTIYKKLKNSFPDIRLDTRKQMHQSKIY